MMADVTTRGFATISRPSQPTRDALVGRVFNNRFRIQALIARGGMGKVYRALQIPLRRVVALKVLNPTYTSEQSGDFHRRFVLEAAIVAQLTHPNTVTVFDYGRSHDDIYYIAMEYLEGMSLREAMRLDAVFAPQRALSIAAQICRSVREAHGLGVVHRDLKPANVFLLQHPDEADFVKVLDFGLVKQVADNMANHVDAGLTQTGIFLGSPGYMSPEQIRGRDVDVRCDIYTLGALLYEMLTGQAPFVRANAMETIMAHVHDALPAFRITNPALQIDPAIEAMVRKCLEKEPAARYASMDVLLATLNQFMPERPAYTVARPADPPRGNTVAPVPMAMEESGWAVVSSTGILSLSTLRARHLARVNAEVARPPVVPLPLPLPAFDPMPANADVDAGVDIDALAPTVALPIPPRLLLPARPPVAPPVNAPRSRYGQAIALSLSLLCLIAASTATWWWTQQRPAYAPPSPQAADRDGKVRLILRSRPTGAAVYLGRSLICAQTPCELEWQRDDAPFGRSMSLRFVLADHDEFIASRVMQGAALTVDAMLYPQG